LSKKKEKQIRIFIPNSHNCLWHFALNVVWFSFSNISSLKIWKIVLPSDFCESLNFLRSCTKSIRQRKILSVFSNHINNSVNQAIWTKMILKLKLRDVKDILCQWISVYFLSSKVIKKWSANMFYLGVNFFKILVVAVWFSNADSKGKNRVNFINVFMYKFLVRTSFLQLFLVTFWLWQKKSYKKHVRKMLMNLTAAHIFFHSFSTDSQFPRFLMKAAKLKRQ